MRFILLLLLSLPTIQLNRDYSEVTETLRILRVVERYYHSKDYYRDYEAPPLGR